MDLAVRLLREAVEFPKNGGRRSPNFSRVLLCHFAAVFHGSWQHRLLVWCARHTVHPRRVSVFVRSLRPDPELDDLDGGCVSVENATRHVSAHVDVSFE
jgi:hypothetical protein